MRVLIIEDEVLTSRRLRQLIQSADDSIDVLAILDSIEDSVEWFCNNSAPDLIFMDIQLSDGLCFEIFNRVKVDSPVIFTTAYDEYAIQAFRVNSIDYLLKPVKAEELERSLDKYNSIKGQSSPSFNPQEIHDLLKRMSSYQQIYRSRFLIRTGQTYIRINCEDIAYFTTENKLTYVVLFNGKKYQTDYTLDTLEKELNPGIFFRISRQFIINVDSVESVHAYFGGSLKLHINPKTDEEVIVSRRRVNGFKEWMDH